MTDAGRVLDVAEAARAIITCLDFRSLDKLLLVLQLDETGRTYLQDNELWNELIELHFRGRLPSELVHLGLPQRPRIWRWTDNAVACSALQEFLRVGDERDHFMKTVSVVRGDIGKIKEIQGAPVDALAFPTNAYLSNHFVGAAGAIYSRAGRELNNYISQEEYRVRRSVGEAVPTPAFDAGVKRLIHCVGPRFSQPNCFERLAVTYENVMHTALAEDLNCVAVASISTGAMGVPPKEGALFALRQIQKFVRANHWNGKVAIVCIEDHVLQAFKSRYAEILANFNVVPDFPEISF
jgi:O-acetyl-ADP-ribose deacetylase (regulator of RNase III)